MYGNTLILEELEEDEDDYNVRSKNISVLPRFYEVKNIFAKDYKNNNFFYLKEK